MHLTTTGTDRQGAFRRGHCSRFAKSRVLLLASAVCLFACCAKEDPQEAEMRRIEREIEAKIAGVPKAMERGTLYDYGRSISDKINCLPDAKQRIEWCKKAIEAVFKVEIGHFGYDSQYKCIGDVNNYVLVICRAWSREHKSLDYAFRRYITTLEWKKRQIDCLKKECAAIKPKSFAKPIPESKFDTFWGLKEAIKSLTGDWYAEVTWYERLFWVEKSKLSPETRVEFRQRFEALLGRPIRTLVQLNDNLRKQIATDLQAEVEALLDPGTNRPPPLILIDGDL